jgi:lysophospholipase L1-like esterase
MAEANEPVESAKINIGRRLGRILIAAVWAATLLLAGALMLEGYLKLKSDRRRSHQAVAPTPVYTRLFDAYKPFAVQHINPFYLFFFPFDTGRRLAMNNDVCSVDADGFRGDGPSRANGRKLAFVLGGSAAFGHFSTSDTTTIPGQLNRLQDEYLFVNAGVPSWNSYQELGRLANQILDHSPDLVIVYDGGNDAALAYDYWQMGLDYPAGTPESFEKLYALVGDIRGARPRLPRKPLYERFFPRLTTSVRFRVFGERPSPTPKLASRATVTPPSNVIQASARRYLANLRHMQAMTQASGGRFIAVLQPFGNLHDSAPQHRKSHPITPFLRGFRDQVFSTPTGLREHLDFSTLLNSLGVRAVWRGRPDHPDLDDDVIFIDGLHLSDRGNQYVAARIVEYLQQTTGADGP